MKRILHHSVPFSSYPLLIFANVPVESENTLTYIWKVSGCHVGKKSLRTLHVSQQHLFQKQTTTEQYQKEARRRKMKQSCLKAK